MIAEITAFLASPVIGGITGVIGSYFQKKQELEIMKERNNHEKSMLQLRSDNKIRETEAQAIAENERLEGEAFVESQDNSSSLGASIRSATRVVLVVYLTMALSWLGYNLHKIVGGLDNLPMDRIFSLYDHVIVSIVYLATTAIVWYFGQRPTSVFRLTGHPTR